MKTTTMTLEDTIKPADSTVRLAADLERLLTFM
jgi:hypothetical protein